jgi:hypothetical protein
MLDTGFYSRVLAKRISTYQRSSKSSHRWNRSYRHTGWLNTAQME